MKKRIAMLLVLVMLFALSATAMADDAVPEEGGKNELQTLSYITAMRLIEGNELNGRFCQVGDMNVDLWVSDVMITQEDIPEDCYWVFEDAGGNVSIKVHGVALNEGLEELEDVEKYVTDLGGVSDGVFWINGYDALVYEQPDKDSLSVVIMVDDGSALEFVFSGISNSDFYTITSLVMSTIQPHFLTTRDVALMIDADLNNTWGPNRDVSFSNDGSTITVWMWDEGVNKDNIVDVKNWDAIRQDKIEYYNLYVRAIDQLLGNDGPVLTLEFTDDTTEYSFLTISGGEIVYEIFE